MIIWLDTVSTSRSPHVFHAPDWYTEDRRKGGATGADMPKDSVEHQDYLSYLLRLWQVEDGERPMWRASLKGVHNRQQVGFASLQDLFRFLRTRTGTIASADGDRQEPS